MWVDGNDIPNYRLNRLCIEVIGLRIVIGRRGDDDVVGPPVSVFFVQRGAEIDGLVSQKILDLGVVDRGLFTIQHRHFFREDV